MIARVCDSCRAMITGDYVQLAIAVLGAHKGRDQDAKADAYGDYCNDCLADGRALLDLAADVNWTLPDRALERSR